MKFSAIKGNKKNLDRLSESIMNNTMPHALLFSGSEGIGKRLAAVAAAAAMNCEKPDSSGACGGCLSCRMLIAGTHPSIRFVGSLKNENIMQADFGKNGTVIINNIVPADEAQRKTIKISIDQIKQIIRESSLKSSGIGRKKIFIIDDIALSSIEALNCLLKVLEEPPPETYFILVTVNDEMLLPTIRSRCQVVRFIPLSHEDMRDFAFMKSESGELEVGDKDRLAELIDISAGVPARLLSLAAVDDLYFENSSPGDFFDDVRKWYSGSTECQEKLKAMLKKEGLRFRNDPSDAGYKRVQIIEEAIESVTKNANIEIAVSNMLIKLGKVDFGVSL